MAVTHILVIHESGTAKRADERPRTRRQQAKKAGQTEGMLTTGKTTRNAPKNPPSKLPVGHLGTIGLPGQPQPGPYPTTAGNCHGDNSTTSIVLRPSSPGTSPTKYVLILARILF